MESRKCTGIWMTIVLVSALCFGSVYGQQLSDSNPAKFRSNQHPSPAQLQSQLAAAQQVKLALQPYQEKFSSDLLGLLYPETLPIGTSLENHLRSMQTLEDLQSPDALITQVSQIQDIAVDVYVYLQDNVSLALVDAYADEISHRVENDNLVVARVKIARLESLAQRAEVRRIETVASPVHATGSVTSEGDAIHRADVARSIYGQGGSGVTVGIISDGVDNRASAQSSGDLPADGSGLTVLSNNQGGDEGTAILEIVHDLAPDANLLFHDNGGSNPGFRDAVDELVAAGADIIIDDVQWLGQPLFEDGVVASHITDVVANNDVVYVTAAGNGGNTHYQGEFTPLLGASNIHDFSGAGIGEPYLYINLDDGEGIRVVMQWDEPFGAAASDYDVYLYSFTTNELVASSTNLQSGSENPFERFSYRANASTAGDFAVVAMQTSGDAHTLEVNLYEVFGAAVYINNIVPGDAVWGHAAVEDVVTVGAIDAADPGNDNLRSYSSQGPSTIMFPPAVRSKPDISAVDGVSVTGAGGFPSTFIGTSAAAAHIAAIAAQLRGQFPDSSSADIRRMLLTSAVDLGDTGTDPLFGAGRSDAFQSIIDNLLVAAPQINPPGGIFTETQFVEMSTNTAESVIYYTLNGEDPEETDSLYTGPIEIDESKILKARAFRSNYTPSPIITEGYQIFRDIGVNIKVFLSGPFDATGDTMSTTLANLGLLPVEQPFNVAPWNYAGAENVSSIPADVVDWILIEMRGEADGPATGRRAAFLLKDGMIVDLDGSSAVGFEFEADADGNYMIVYHRNHLAIMSSQPMLLSENTPLYDFSIQEDQAFGFNPMSEVSPGIFALYPGDGNLDGGVDALDKNLIWRLQNGMTWSYDSLGDFNLDGGIDALDLNILWRPNNGKASQVP